MVQTTTEIAVYKFSNITVYEKVMQRGDSCWRYTVSGNGDKYILSIVSNTSGHLMALPLAEEFRDSYTTIALSVPPVKTFADAAAGLEALLNYEGVTKCHAIGHSNGGVYLQSLKANSPGLIHKVVFSHSLTSMDKNDPYTTNASEVKLYKLMRRMLKVLPVSVLTFAMGHMVLTKLSLQSGQTDTKQLITLCKEDMKRITRQDFLTIADCMEDFLFNYTFTPEPYRSAPHDVLIVDSPTDKVANPLQRAQMLKLCPGAQEYHFPTGGHVTLVNCKDEYFSLLKTFWN